MKKINRKILSIIVLSLCLALTLFGCGDSKKVSEISVSEANILEVVNTQPFDYHAIKVSVKYNNGEVKEVSLDDSMLSSEMIEKLNKEGVQTIKITYEGVSTTFTINIPSKVVIVDRNVTEISIDEQSVKDALALEVFDYHAIKLNVKYDDNTEEAINLQKEMLTDEMLKKFISKGEQTIVVTYEGKETSFKIKMPTAVVRYITINEESLENSLKEEVFDFSNIRINLQYSNGKVVTEKVTGDMFSITDLALLYSAGEHDIKVTYHSLETTFKVNNEKDLTIDINKLNSVADGKYVAVKGYATAYSSSTIYLHADNSGTYAKTNYGITKRAEIAGELAENYEIIVVGKKVEENGIAILENVSNLAKTDKVSSGETITINNDSQVAENLYAYVTVSGATLVERPGYLYIDKDSSIKINLNGKEMLLVCPKDNEKELSEKMFVKWSELLRGHELTIENVLAVKYNSEDAFFITKNSLFDYKKVNHEYVREEGEDNQEFNKFLTDLFIEEIGTNPMDINYQIFDINAFDEKYGTDLKNAKVKPSSYEDYSPILIDEYNAILKTKEELLSFDREKLSPSQKLTYDVILDKINTNLKMYKLDENGEDLYYYYGTQLGSLLGYQAQLPSIIAEYRFDDKKDIEDYLDCLRYTLNDFQVLFAFEKEKVDAGKGQQLTDYVIDAVIEQCDSFIETGEENYLIKVFDGRIGSYDFLTLEEVENYKKLNKEVIVNDFIPAYVWLKDNLLQLKEINDDSKKGSLSECEYGKDYYEALFQQTCGTSMTVEELIKYMDEKLALAEEVSNHLTAYSGNYMIDSGAVKYLNGTTNIDYYESLNNVIPFMQIQSSGDFPLLKNPYVVGENIAIKPIAVELQENSSPAFYLVTPFDANVDEVIYYNPPEFSEVGNYMYQTLAHEGWPGHMFQNVYAKEANMPEIRYVLSYKGYSEGWANYVENYVVKYALPDNYSAQQLALLDPLQSFFACKIDIGVNYLNWKVEDVIKHYGLTVEDVKSGKYQFTNGEKVTMEYFEDLYYNFVELPTNYLMYFFSASQLLDIKDEFKDAMGVNYSEKLFHTIYLESGECSFDTLRTIYQDYANKYGA